MTSYHRTDRSVSMTTANLLGMLALIPIAGLGLVYLIVWDGAQWQPPLWELPLLLVALIVGIPVHEGLHALATRYAAGIQWSNISFGVDKKTLSPYFHCNVPISARAYRIGVFAPGLILGILPLLVGLGTGQLGLFLYGALFTLAASGDLLILWLIRQVPADALVEDHPTRAGCYVLQPAK